MSFGFFGGLLPLPSCSFREFHLLQESLGRPDQDPEWVRLVQATLLSSPPAELAANCQSFLRTEIAAETQAMIIELYKTIFYGRESPELFIPSRDLDLLVRVAFEQMHIDFNCETLSQIHQSLFIYHHQSPFYSTVLESRAFEILWTRYQKKLMVAHRCDLQAAEFFLLQERVEELMVQREWILSRLRHNW